MSAMTPARISDSVGITKPFAERYGIGTFVVGFAIIFS
jgi:hypothetical protein